MHEMECPGGGKINKLDRQLPVVFSDRMQAGSNVHTLVDAMPKDGIEVKFLR